MERSEPELVPEWLRSTGNVSGGGNSAHHSASSSSLSDVSSSVHRGRSRISRNISDFDSPSFAFLNRASSLNSRRSSNNGSSRHAYSSFSRSHRDKDREWDKERLSFGVRWDSDSSDPLESILTSSVEKLGGISTSKVETDTFRQSHSMVSRKQAETFPQRTAVDSRDSGNSNNNNGNGLVSGGAIGSSIQKAAFRKDFPSLGTEEMQSVPEIARVSSPGLSSVSQCLSVGNSALIDAEGWTSTLAESPTVVGSCSTGSLPVPLAVSTPVSGAPSVTSAPNMAVALAQAPSRARAASQLSVNTQRLEDLAIKQSRQLIPVTPSMPKGSVLNSVDKSKAKPASRTSDVNMAVKSGQQQPSFIHNGNQSPHSTHFKSDMQKTSGKLLVLKPGWENGGSSPTKKETSIPTTTANSRVITSQSVISPISSAAARNSSNSKLSVGEPKVASLDPIAGFNSEKRPSLAQTQSRNDFFNLLKKKTPSNSSAGLSDSDTHISCSTTVESDVTKEIVGASVTAHANKKGSAATSNDDVCQEPQRFSNDDKKDFSSTAMVHSDEEEIAFLRSLGWEENSTDDEGLTEEEINDFYREYMKLRSSMELCNGILSKLAESLATKLNGASSESIPPDSRSES
ncbi:ankyrin repeat and KH domain-containing protein mask-like isoform X2 [Hibiscus syriacus]|uniref:ankyrin repeat and KH domain-containing protein mask-like isoform X2 n=1 Tax=Hibiscus syriacus TaxID=106335 RepID=UPI0019225C76|nr:ankyrin repeat and KH domain-containing protein mask-like isoform X2 [Hibiscus syriacus]